MGKISVVTWQTLSQKHDISRMRGWELQDVSLNIKLSLNISTFAFLSSLPAQFSDCWWWLVRFFFSNSLTKTRHR